ncbi:hypothetical protein ABZP36_014717 [Zizania latifolia]
MPPPPPPPPPHQSPPPPSPLPPLSAHRLPLQPATSPPTSLLLAPRPSPSRALALLFPDFSARLFPSLPTPSPASSPAPTVVPAPLAAAACFVLLLPSSHLLFLSAHPSPSSPVLHLRAYTLSSGRFSPAQLSFKRQASASGLPLHGLPFGLGVRLAGGVNAVALLSLAAGQIWVLAPRMAADRRTVELHKCAVVELEPARPVYVMEVAMGRLLLGEAGGVRVFPLRDLMKSGIEREGRKESVAAAVKKSLYKKNGILNGFIVPVGHGSGGGGDKGEAVSTRKLTTLRVKQTLGSYCSFVSTFSSEDHNSQGGIEVTNATKVVSIHPLSKEKFLVLDSAGVLHVFSPPNKELFSEATSKGYCGSRTYRLDNDMKVQLFAVFPSSSTKTQIFWVSDGGHSIHIMSALDSEPPNSENGGGDVEREFTTIKLRAIEAIFTSEKVQDIVPISKDAVLILGQGNMFLYETA